MTEAKAAKESTPDSKTGKARPKSGVSVPYYDIEQSIAVARAIHEKGGGTCSREQLAVLLKYSGTNNGGFLTRVSAAKMFGFIEEHGDMLRITQRARTILSPVMPADADRAKVDAFMSVDFLQKFYERFKGGTLPQEVGIKNLLETTYGIVPNRIIPSVRVLMDSAEQAGFFKASNDRSRMVMPLIGSGAADRTASIDIEQKPNVDDVNTEKQTTRSSVGSGTEIPAALLGLLEKLPAVGTPIAPKRRAALIGAFTSTINYLYPEIEDGSQ